MRYLPAAILCYFVAFAGLLAVLVPPFEGPDEYAHVEYITFVARTGRIPNQYDQASKVPWEGHQPPLYYFLAAGVVRIVKPDGINFSRHGNPKHFWSGGPSGDVPVHSHAFHDPFPTAADSVAFYGLRLLSVIFGVGTLLCVLALSRRLIPDPRWALVPMLMVATLAQFAAMSAAVSNDPLLCFLASALVLALFADRGFIICGTLLGLALLTKKSALCLVPIVAVASWRSLFPAVAIAGWYFVRNRVLYGDWLGSAMEEATMPGFAIHRTLLDTYFVTAFPKLLGASTVGLTGYMSVWLPDWVYSFYGTLAFASVVGLCFRRWSLKMALLLATCLFAFGGLVFYNLTFSQPQGRLLFCALGPLSILLALGLQSYTSLIPRLLRRPCAVALVGLLLAIDVSDAVTVRTFYYHPGQYYGHTAERYVYCS
jgi:Dolichyl-phosphate-mannose-protein mannosyltransferase